MDIVLRAARHQARTAVIHNDRRYTCVIYVQAWAVLVFRTEIWNDIMRDA